jgi:hypothetical protein
MSRVGFEPTMPEFERAKIVHALDCVATVIGIYTTISTKIENINSLSQISHIFFLCK